MPARRRRALPGQPIAKRTGFTAHCAGQLAAEHPVGPGLPVECGPDTVKRGLTPAAYMRAKHGLWALPDVPQGSPLKRRLSKPNGM